MRRFFKTTTSATLICVAMLFACSDGKDGRDGIDGAAGKDGKDGADATAVRIEILNSPLAVGINEGKTGQVVFRINPSNATVPTGSGSAIAKWALDQTGTRASYVNPATGFELESIEKDGDKEGQYIATIRCTGTSDGVNYMIALVLNTGSDTAPVLVSSSTFTLNIMGSGSYSYDDEVFEIAWAGYYHDVGSGYCFGISPTVPAGQLFGGTNFFEVDFPEDRLGEKLDLSQDCDGAIWSFYGYFNLDGTQYYFAGYNTGLSGSDNWMTVTKEEGTGNFTLEFAMTIGGKRLEGNYTGAFIKKDNYYDVGADD